MAGVIQTTGPTKNACKKPGEWNQMTVTMKGDQLVVIRHTEANGYGAAPPPVA